MREGPHLPTLYDIHFFHVHLLHLPTYCTKTITDQLPSQKASKKQSHVEYINLIP